MEIIYSSWNNNNSPWQIRLGDIITACSHCAFVYMKCEYFAQILGSVVDWSMITGIQKSTFNIDQRTHIKSIAFNQGVLN